MFAFLPGFPYRLEQYDLPKDVALGIFGSLCALHLLASTDRGRADPLGLTLAAFIAWGLITALLVGDSAVLALRTLGLYAAAAAVFLLARRAGQAGAAPAIVGGTLLIIGLMSAVVLLEAYGGMPFLSAPGRRPGATLGNRNLAARLVCLAIPLLWIRLFVADRRASRYVVLAVLSAAVTVIVLSRSRAALLVVCVLAVVLPAVTRWLLRGDTHRHWRTALGAWIAALLLGSAVAVFLPNRMGWSAADFGSSARRVTEYQTGTGRGRVIQAATTWRMIRAHPPWGVGPGNWSVVYPAYAPQHDPSVIRGAFYPGPQTPRSDVLPLVAEWGVMGVSLGMVFLVVLGRRTADLIVSRHQGAQLNGMLVLGVVVTATMLGLFDSVLRIAPTLALAALLVGVALGHGEVQAGLAPTGSARRSSYVWPAAWGVVGLLSVQFARSAAQDLRALRIINSSASTGDLARAVSIAPNNVEARARLSYVLVSVGRCDLARPHLQRAAQLQPFSEFFPALQARCARVPK